MQKNKVAKTILILAVVLAFITGLFFLYRTFSGFFQKARDAFGSNNPISSFSGNKPENAKNAGKEFIGSDALIDSVFYPKDKAEQPPVLPEGRILDMRPHLQTLVNRWSTLDQAALQKLVKIVYPEKYGKKTGSSMLLPPNTPDSRNQTAWKAQTGSLQASSLPLNLGVAAFSLPLSLDPLEVEIYDGIFLITYDPELHTSHDAISDAVFDSAQEFELLSFQKPAFRIEIIPYDMPACLSSYSVFLPADFADLISKPVFRIFIDPNASEDIQKASIVHELFHAYQEQALFSGPVSMNGETVDWLREATALWAVDRVYPANDYELGSVGTIYINPNVDYTLLEECGAHTWYQMFYYFTKVLYTCDSSYVHSLFADYKMKLNMDAAFNEAHGAREDLNRDFADLGMALFGGVEEEKTFESAEPFYPSSTVYIADEDIVLLEEILDNSGSEWQEYTFNTPGFHYMMISIPEGYEGRLIFSQSLPLTAEDELRTGMRLAVHRDNEWKWEETTYEPSLLAVDIKEDVDSVLFMLFSTSFEQPETVQYQVSPGSSQKAKGTIEVKWEKEFKTSEDKAQKETMTTTFTEELEKTDSEAEDAQSQAMAYMATGERYFVKHMVVNQTYHSFSQDGQETKEINGTGSYSYNSDTGGSAGFIPSLPEIPGLSDLEDIMNNQLIPSLEELEEMMGGLENQESQNESDAPSIPELPELLPDTPDMPELPVFPDIPELPDLSGLSLPEMGLGMGSLSRIVLWPNIGAFEFYPVLPPDIASEKWMNYEYTHIYPDPAMDGKLSSNELTYADTPYELLPLWFVNPDFSPDAGEDLQFKPEDMADIEDTQEMMDIIASMQTRLNKMNLQKLIDNPNESYVIDIRDTIDPVPESAILKEKASFIDDTFEAELTAEVITAKGNVITVTINAKYSFE